MLSGQTIINELIRNMEQGRFDKQLEATREEKTAALAESAVIQVTAEAPDPVLAAAVANAVGQVGEARMSQLYPIYDLTVVTSATPPTSVYRPDLVRNGSLGLLFGLLLGVFAAYAYDAVSATATRVRN